MLQNKQSGFSLLEILIALGIVLMISAGITASLQHLRESGALDSGKQQLISVLQEARGSTLASKDRSAYGVYMSTSTAELYKGDDYISGTVERTVTLTDTLEYVYEIDGGGSDIHFERLSGETSSSTITIRFIDKPDTWTTVKVTEAGVVE